MKLLEFYTLESIDFPKLMDVYRESNEDNLSFFYPEETDLDKGRRLVEQKFYDYLKTDFYNKQGNRYYALEDNGEWLSAIRLFPVEGKDNTFFAEALETAPAHRRKGYARKLMELLFEKLRKEGSFEITDTVNKSNEASLQFHLNCGFEKYKDPACCILNGKVDEKAYTMRYVEKIIKDKNRFVAIMADLRKMPEKSNKITAYGAGPDPYDFEEEAVDVLGEFADVIFEEEVFRDLHQEVVNAYYQLYSIDFMRCHEGISTFYENFYKNNEKEDVLRACKFFRDNNHEQLADIIEMGYCDYDQMKAVNKWFDNNTGEIYTTYRELMFLFEKMYL